VGNGPLEGWKEGHPFLNGGELHPEVLLVDDEGNGYYQLREADKRRYNYR